MKNEFIFKDEDMFELDLMIADWNEVAQRLHRDESQVEQMRHDVEQYIIDMCGR